MSAREDIDQFHLAWVAETIDIFFLSGVRPTSDLALGMLCT
jgi:hypothetical protein